MDWIKMWTEGGVMMPCLVAPAMVGIVGLGIWQVLAVRGGVAPKLFHGGTVTLLGVGLYCTGVGLRLLLGIMAAEGGTPELMFHGLRIALQPLVFVFAATSILGVLHLAVIFRTAGPAARHTGVTTRLRVVASLATLLVALSAIAGAMWIGSTSAAVGHEIENPREYVAMLYRLSTVHLTSAALAVVLGLTTVGMAIRARGGRVQETSRATHGEEGEEDECI
jgi:hypothetical protein